MAKLQGERLGVAAAGDGSGHGEGDRESGACTGNLTRRGQLLEERGEGEAREHRRSVSPGPRPALF